MQTDLWSDSMWFESSLKCMQKALMSSISATQCHVEQYTRIAYRWLSEFVRYDGKGRHARLCHIAVPHRIRKGITRQVVITPNVV